MSQNSFPVRIHDQLRRPLEDARKTFGSLSKVAEAALLDFLGRPLDEQIALVRRAADELDKPGPTASDRTTE